MSTRGGGSVGEFEEPELGLEGIVDVTMRGPLACASPKIGESCNDGGGGVEVTKSDQTDWQSVVKDMLSIHLPTSKLQPRPIVTQRSQTSPFGANELSHSHKSFAACAFSAEPEPLRSGSPRASRSPLAAASPRSSISGLHLLRIDESQALDTSSDCGSDVGDMHDLSGFQDERQPFGQPFRRSRLGTDGAQVRSTLHGSGEWDAGGDGESRDVPASSSAQEMVAEADSSSQSAMPGSDVVSLEGLHIRTAASVPAGKQPSVVERTSLAQYRPEPCSLGKMAAVFPESHVRKMRRSVNHRISDHGGSLEHEEGRLKLEEDRLALDGMRRDVEATVGGLKGLTVGSDVQRCT